MTPTRQSVIGRAHGALIDKLCDDGIMGDDERGEAMHDEQQVAEVTIVVDSVLRDLSLGLRDLRGGKR